MFIPPGIQPKSSRLQRVELAFLLLVFAMNIYRAITQSITHDEAFAHNLLLHRTWPELFTTFTDNHHVLYTYLSKLSIQLFGLSELTLRLPSLLGGLLYLLSAFALARRLILSTWLQFLTVALLALDANLLDHMSAARGYGLGLGFLSASLLFMLRAVDKTPERNVPVSYRCLFASGTGIGLSAASNLAYVVPGAAFAIALAASLLYQSAPGTRIPIMRAWLGWCVFPSLIIFIGLAGGPLLKMKLSQFYVGTLSLSAAEDSILSLSFHRHGGLGGWLSLLTWDFVFLKVLHIFLLAVLALVGLFILLRLVRPRGNHPLSPGGEGLSFLGAGMFLTLGLMVAGRLLCGIRYPEARMGLLWTPLITLCALGLVQSFWNSSLLRRALAYPLLVVCVLILANDLIVLDVSHYENWAFDRSTRHYVDIIRERHRTEPTAPVRVRATWLFEPGINFYRERHNLSWMEPVTRSKPKGLYDYYMLLDDDRKLVEKLGLEELARDNMANSVLAAKAKNP
jgi:hypothetical protein